MSTILIIDDSVLVNNLLCESLSSHGYTVLQAHDANEGYKRVQQQAPDLILLDIVLPDVSGVQLCQAFRNHPSTRHIPIILVSGTASSAAEKVKGLQAGADDYILKPFEMEELLERVRAVLRRAQAAPQTDLPLNPTLSNAGSTETEAKPSSDLSSPTISIADTLGRVLLAPTTLPRELPPVSLFFLITMVVLLTMALAAAPGSSIKPILACVSAVLFWGFLVAALVVMSSLVGLSLKWREGAQLFSLAAIPVLLKLGCALVFSAATTLSPFLFSASPFLFFPQITPWASRLDVFELGSVGLLSILLRTQADASRAKARLIAFVVWILSALAAGLLAPHGGL